MTAGELSVHLAQSALAGFGWYESLIARTGKDRGRQFRQAGLSIKAKAIVYHDRTLTNFPRKGRK